MTRYIKVQDVSKTPKFKEELWWHIMKDEDGDGFPFNGEMKCVARVETEAMANAMLYALKGQQSDDMLRLGHYNCVITSLWNIINNCDGRSISLSMPRIMDEAELLMRDYDQSTME